MESRTILLTIAALVVAAAGFGTWQQYRAATAPGDPADASQAAAGKT